MMVLRDTSSGAGGWVSPEEDFIGRAAAAAVLCVGWRSVADWNSAWKLWPGTR